MTKDTVKTYTQLKIITHLWSLITKNIKLKVINHSFTMTKFRIKIIIFNNWRTQWRWLQEEEKLLIVVDLVSKEELNLSFKVLDHQLCKLVLSFQMKQILIEIQILELKEWCKRLISIICKNLRKKEQKLTVKELFQKKENAKGKKEI